MTRIDGVSRKQAGPLIRLVYRFSRRALGRDVDPIAVYAHAPRLLIGYGAFEQATAKQHRVDERLKALAETKAAAVVNCEFCCDIASSIAREAGVTEAQLLALPRYRESEEFSALERLVLDYAVAMSRTPACVNDDLFASLREHFDERQLVELTNAIAIENMRARFNSAFDMAPAGFSEGMVCAMPEPHSVATAGRAAGLASPSVAEPARTSAAAAATAGAARA
jgi:alkylhydroperoxidase family enzyme